jgi:tRNA G18 (ribose-2'-O)-methylase SpoU
MPRVAIADLDDPRIETYRHLKATNRTRRGDRFVVEGEKLLDRLLASPFPTVSALVDPRHEERVAARLPGDVPLYVLPEGTIDLLVGYNFHQGVLACGARRPWPGLDVLAGSMDRTATVVVCPRLDNPENLGALIRLGDVFGVDALLVGPRCPDPLSRRVLRVSMGTALRLPVVASEDLEGDVARLVARHGFETAATVTDVDAEPIDTFRRPDRLALVFGSESAGIDPAWAARCDHRLTIPMSPGAESLNVAVAAGIILHHVSRSTATPLLRRRDRSADDAN